MEVRLAAGAVIDLASKDEMSKSFDTLGELVQRKPARPFRRPITQSGFMPSSGGLVLDFQAPPAGRVWNLLGVTTFGSDDATTVANAKVAIYCGSPDPTGLGLSELKIPALVVPTFLTITKEVLWASRTENIIANVTGATAGTVVGVTVHIAEWREEDVFADTGK